MRFSVPLSALFSSIVAAAPHGRRVDNAVPLPSEDPFYTPPPLWQQAAPGDILRIREAPGNLTSIFTNASTIYDILYRSTDSNYMPTYGFTTLFCPWTTAEGNANQVLSYLAAYDSPNVDAGTTTLLYGGPSVLTIVYTDIQTALSEGWYVSVPDFEGPQASFICEVQSAYSTLDSVRAVLSQISLSHSSHSSSRAALWGYSGGSIAGEMALELQVQYAPELTTTLVGAALGGIAPNITDVLYNSFSVGLFSWLTPSILVGFATQHPDVEDYLMSELKPTGPVYNASNFLAVKRMTAQQATEYYANQTMANYFKSGLDFFQAPVLQTAFARDASAAVHGLPQVPMFIYKAIHDEVPSVASADALVDRLCEYSGTNILYERNTIGGHGAEEYNGDARALAWLKMVLDATYEHVGCTIRNVTIDDVSDSPL